MTLSDGIAIIALLVSLLAWFTAYRAQEAANDIARKQLRHETALSSARDTPVLTFEVNTIRSNGVRPVCEIEVLIHNGGQYPTEIVEGHIALKSNKYPEAEQPQKLSGLKVLAGTPRLIKFGVKHAVVYRERSEIPATELECKAIYTRLDQENGEAYECYVFSETQGRFVPK
jgi:hypothetical protein